MRIPHYLHRAQNGTWHYRQRMPRILFPLLKKTEIKKALGTRELGPARELALHLWRAYDELHTSMRALGMAGKSSIADIIARLKREGRHYRLVQKPDGTIEVEALGAEDHAQAMEAVMKIGEMHKEALVQHLLAHPPVAPTPAARLTLAGPAAPASLPAPSPVPVPVRAGHRDLSMGLNGEPLAAKPATRAVDEWVRDIQSGTRPKTLVIKKMAVNDFVSVFGEMRPLYEVNRVEIGQWVSELRARTLATPTIVNRISYLKGFLEWAKGKSFMDFPRNDNPASGHVTYKAREKRLRKKHGFRAFNDSQLKLLFAPESLKKLSADARLGTWMGLYLGARVSEIGQLAVSDFFDVDGIPCLRITDEGAGQSTKNDASNRVVPVHPELIRMGLLSRVERLRKAGERQLFPKVGKGAMNGMGDWLSKAFGRYMRAQLPVPDVGKYGFHSFRKTVVQTMQAAGVQAEHRAAYVGHELDDEHHERYGMDVPKQQILDAISHLDYPVKPDEGAFN